jgi:MarR family transcriptional regulator, organic hydroperoxide resistance regulator
MAALDPGREAWMLLFRLLHGGRDVVLAVWSEFELSRAQGNLLLVLQPRRPATMVSLEERGILERRADPKDRRVKLIALTSSGESFRERLVQKLSEPPPFITSLTLSDRRALRNLLRKASARNASESRAQAVDERSEEP